MSRPAPTVNRSRRLLHVVTSTDRRGAEVFGTQLGDALGGLGWDTRTVALAPGRTVPRLDLPVLGDRPLAPATLAALRRAAAGSLVVAHGSTTLPACALAAAGVAPFVYRNIGDPGYWAGPRYRRTRVGLLLRRARAVVALSERMAGVLARSFGVRPDRLAVIPNGVPSAAFPPTDGTRRAAARAAIGIEAAGPVIVYVGALRAEKDVGAAVEAAGHLDGATLVVAGDGPDRAVLERLAAQRAPGRVHFLGVVESSSDVLAAADVVVLPSRTEGLPGVLIEAAFTGVPAVATRVGAVDEVVVDGATGILVEAGDRLALAGALEAVLADPLAMGERARAHCLARFDLDVVAASWDRLLSRVTGD